MDPLLVLMELIHFSPDSEFFLPLGTTLVDAELSEDVTLEIGTTAVF
jgi:hypothetical protein